MRISGVYLIINKLNGNFYVGSSIDINKRISTHKRYLIKKIHHSTILQNAYNKYGINNLEFEVFIECNYEDNLILEQFCLDFLNPIYNISKDAIAPMQDRKHTKNTLLKMSEADRPKGKEHHLYGSKWSKSLREKILKSRIGGKRSEKTKKKMSETAKRINSISRIDRSKQRKKIKDSFNNIFISLTETAKFHDVATQTVCDILKGRHLQTRKGVSFEYV